MDELIIRAIQGRAEPDQLRELRRWREAEENERRYQEIRAVWVLTGVREEIRTDARIPLAQGITDASGRGVRPLRRWLLPSVAVAAALVLGVGITRLVSTVTEPAPPTTAEFRTGPNELTTAVLDDGTVVRLAPSTTLEASIGDGRRDIRLEGQAFFAVVHDPDRTFQVRTDAGDVRVLGTRFEVDSKADRFRLLVLDGRVRLSAGGEEAELGAGELGETAKRAPPTVIRVEVPEAFLGWMGAWVAFESTPLAQVARELEVRLGVRIEIADPSIAHRTITGWFAEEDRDQMVEMICRVADVRCTKRGAVIHMKD